jgi:hypothetical protein
MLKQLIERLFGTTSKFVLLKGNGNYDFEVVGEATYQAALRQICGGKTPDGHNLEAMAALVCEENNKFDKHAVTVEIEGRIVGYLPRDIAAYYRAEIAGLGAARASVKCRAVIKGGWDRGEDDRGHFGVWLDVARPLAIEATQ